MARHGPNDHFARARRVQTARNTQRGPSLVTPVDAKPEAVAEPEKAEAPAKKAPKRRKPAARKPAKPSSEASSSDTNPVKESDDDTKSSNEA